ncbi:hypothetical protein FB451DRAFT_1185127 [Mycena latifolia]|nr:hypothetical protein FB451DRAFT_1185127 [Mycena latifolia]
MVGKRQKGIKEERKNERNRATVNSPNVSNQPRIFRQLLEFVAAHTDLGERPRPTQGITTSILSPRSAMPGPSPLVRSEHLGQVCNGFGMPFRFPESIANTFGEADLMARMNDAGAPPDAPAQEALFEALDWVATLNCSRPAERKEWPSFTERVPRPKAKRTNARFKGGMRGRWSRAMTARTWEQTAAAKVVTGNKTPVRPGQTRTQLASIAKKKPAFRG